MQEGKEFYNKTMDNRQQRDTAPVTDEELIEFFRTFGTSSHRRRERGVRQKWRVAARERFPDIPEMKLDNIISKMDKDGLWENQAAPPPYTEDELLEFLRGIVRHPKEGISRDPREIDGYVTSVKAKFPGVNKNKISNLLAKYIDPEHWLDQQRSKGQNQ